MPLAIGLFAGCITGGQGGGGVALSPNQVLLAAAKSARKLSICGASRFKQMAVGASNQLRSLPTGNTSWAQMLDRRFDVEYWYDATANQNSFNMNGGIFAADGDGFNQMWNRLPKIVASDFKIVILEMPSGGVQFEDYDIYAVQTGALLTVNGFVNNMKLMANYLIDHGVAVIVSSLWERNTLAGGPWASGQAPRLLVPSIDTAMAAWCATVGIPFLDTRSVMIDQGSGDKNPYTALVRTDGTHYSTQGGYASGKLLRDFIDDYFDAAPASAVETGNLTQNPLMSGVGGSGLTGVIATGLTGSRLNASTATVVASKVTDGQKLTIDTTLMTPATVEGVQLAVALNATTSGVWYQCRVIAEVSAWDGWKGTPNMLFDAGTRDVWVMPPVNTGGSVDTTIGLTAAQGPTEAYTVELISGKVLADTTSPTASLRIYFTPGTGNGEIVFKQVQIYPVSDPTVLMYDESSVLTPSITSSASLSIPENADYTHTLTANMPGKWSISGTDALLIGTPDQHGRLVITSKDYEIPTDADANNIYTATITFTPYDLRRSAVTQTLNVTITDVNDGFTDVFTGTDGTDLAVYSANWTRVDGSANAINISGNDAVNNAASTTPRTAYLAPQQGNTARQEIRWGAFSSSAGLHMGLRVTDKDNALVLLHNGGVPKIYSIIAGTRTLLYTPTLYKTLASGDEIIATDVGGVVYIYQNGVLVGSYNASAILPAVVRSGLVSNLDVGSNNKIKYWNNREAPSAAYTSKVGLYAITFPLTASPGDYAGTLTGKTIGSTITVAVTKSGVPQPDWIADGNVLRGPGATTGSYVVAGNEYFAGAVNDGRALSGTIVIS